MPSRVELPGWFIGMGKDAGRTGSRRFPCPSEYAPLPSAEDRKRTAPGRKPGFFINIFDLEEIGHEETGYVVRGVVRPRLVAGRFRGTFEEERELGQLCSDLH